jgi:probable O-glycosylation ligase (exosortase A-associated)
MLSRTTLFWILIYSSGTLASFVNPVFGVMTYLFEYYLRPSLHWWGLPLPVLRYNYIISIVTIVTFVMHRSSLPSIVNAHRGPGGFLAALAMLMLVITPMAVDPARSWQLLTDSYLKFFLFHLLIVGTIRAEWAFDAFVLVHLFGAGWWGWEVYVDPKREASRLYNIGSGDTIGDNKAAVHLLSVIPLALIYAMTHDNKWVKGFSALVAPFVINALILCNSRGATVGIAAALVSTLPVAKSGHRVRALAAGVALVGLFYVLADPEFIERQQTIANYQDDGSATSRIESWQGGLELIKDYPLGAGGGGYDRLSPVYIRDVVMMHDGAERAPHNTFVLVAAEWGILGLTLYVGYYGCCLWLLHRVRKTSPEGGIWYYRAVALHMAMVGLFVGGAFTDRLYSEAPFWMGGLVVALHRLNEERLARGAAATERAESPSPFADLHPAAAHVAAAQTGRV